MAKYIETVINGVKSDGEEGFKRSNIRLQVKPRGDNVEDAMQKLSEWLQPHILLFAKHHPDLVSIIPLEDQNKTYKAFLKRHLSAKARAELTEVGVASFEEFMALPVDVTKIVNAETWEQIKAAQKALAYERNLIKMMAAWG